MNAIDKKIDHIIEKWYYGSKPLEWPKMQAMLEPDLRELVELAQNKPVGGKPAGSP